MPRKRRLPKNVTAYVDRHGKERLRYRKTGEKTYSFKHPFGTKDFYEELALCRAGTPLVIQRYTHGTVGWLAGRFKTSMAFLSGKSAVSAKNSWAILEKFVAEYANDRIADFRFDHIEEILRRAAEPRVENGRKRGGPHAALNLRGELLPFFRYGMKHGLTTQNPVELADTPTAPRSKGFHTWADAEIEQFRDYWKLGTSARLALEIFLWTALRRGDGASFGRSHMHGGKIEQTNAKTGETVWLPAAPQLVEAIEAMAVTGTEAYLVTSFGKPFSEAGLGNKMREWCNDAGLPHCTAHGLRKAAARRVAEHGGTNSELKAVGGWTTDNQVNNYTRAANREHLAKRAMQPVIDADLAARKRKSAKPDP